jgi:hypothetical protein
MLCTTGARIGLAAAGAVAGDAHAAKPANANHREPLYRPIRTPSLVQNPLMIEHNHPLGDHEGVFGSIQVNL